MLIEPQQTHPAALRAWAARRPDHPALAFVTAVSESAYEGRHLTYGELLEAAEDVARELDARELRGRHVLLLFSPGEQFVVATLGCFLAGVVAVPAPPPGAGLRGEGRLRAIVCDADVPLVVSGTDDAADVAGWLTDVPVEQVGLDDLRRRGQARRGTGDPPPLPDPQDTAFVQYTSGSTSAPKGVVVTHAALAANLRDISTASEADEHTRSVSWLPHYHDMGLVGQILAPLWNGGTAYLMSPTSFLRRPQQWLSLISMVRAQYTAAPDFAYLLLARRTADEQLARLDLSCVRSMLNGSEPVHAETLERFAQRFAPAGLAPEAVVACYGMAEATLYVTSGSVHEPVRTLDVDAEELAAHHRLRPAVPDARSQRLVSSGRPLSTEVTVVDPQTRRRCPSGQIGEIWLRGPSLASGYHGQDELTEETFRARLDDDAGPGWLRTGDLGCLLDGELYVTGRRKEMMIVNGRNVYPQDVERTVRAAHPLTQDGPSAVFSAPDEHAAPVAVQEVRAHDLTRTDPADVVEQIRRAVRTEHDLQLSCVLLVPKGSISRTTSGKIQRTAMREAFVAGQLKTLHRSGALR